jgi:hypothetical protein
MSNAEESTDTKRTLVRNPVAVAIDKIDVILAGLSPREKKFILAWAMDSHGPTEEPAK